MELCSMGQVELSFVIPAYNEEFFIEDTLGTLDFAIKDEKFQLRNRCC